MDRRLNQLLKALFSTVHQIEYFVAMQEREQREANLLDISDVPPPSPVPEWVERGIDIDKINKAMKPEKPQHIDNLIDKFESNVENPNLTQEEMDLMRLNKGIRKRADGRYDWRKMINGVLHYLINSDLKELIKEINRYKKANFKKEILLDKKLKEIKNTESRVLYDLCYAYYKRHIEGEIASDINYLSAINKYISRLIKRIDEYTKDELIDFLKSVESKKQSQLCFYLLRHVFNDEDDKGTLTKNVFKNIKAPENKAVKGIWFNVVEQNKIYNNRHCAGIGDEIEFFLMTGCRLSEAYNCRIEFDKCRIFITRTKRNETSGYVKISKRYCEYLKPHWECMFKHHKDYYAEKFGELLNSLKIARQKNEKPIHRLRHTFATNIYYLGIKDSKKRAYLLGHKSSQITDDIYTDFDPDITKKNITDTYGDLYPRF